MKKKEKLMKDFGREICLSFFDVSDHQFYESLWEFLKKHADKRGTILEARACLKDKYPEIADKLPEIEEDIVDAYMNTLIGVGFVLGQMFDLGSPESKKEMEYLKTWMKQKDWFFVYGRDRKAA